MSDKIQTGMLVVGVEPEKAGIDGLLARAQAATASAKDAERLEIEKQMAVVASKKSAKDAVAARAKEEKVKVLNLSPEGVSAENYDYESLLLFYEKELDGTRPEKINATIAALQEISELLRRQADTNPKSNKSQADTNPKSDELQLVHGKLLVEIKKVIADLMDQVWRKCKSEEAVFAEQFKILGDSPFIKGVEFVADSPEAREKTLKLEIVEILFTPVVDERLGVTEKKKLEAEERITTLQSAFKEASDIWKKESTQVDTYGGSRASYTAGSFARKNKLIVDVHDHKNYSEWDIIAKYNAEINRLETIKKNCELAILKDRLTLAMNRSIVEETLSEEHDEVELRTAMVEIRTVLANWRELMNGRRGRTSHWEGEIPALKHPLAQRVLGRLFMYGQSMAPGGYDSGVVSLSLAEQMLGKPIDGSSRDYNALPAGLTRLEAVALQGFGDSKVPGLSKFLDFNRLDSENFTLTNIMLGYSHINLNRDPNPAVQEPLKEFLKDFPTVEALVAHVFAGEGKFLNMGLAYQEVMAGLNGDSGRYQKAFQGKWAPLKQNGWKESRLGALVEPGQESREADGEYVAILDKFSKPQMDSATRLFDVRGPDGSFIVLTVGQAKKMVSLVISDARRVLFKAEADSASALATSMEQGARADRAEGHVVRLERDYASSVAREKALVLALREAQGREATLQLQIEVVRGLLSDSNIETRNLLAGRRDDEKVLKATGAAIRDALKNKGGVFGESNKLRPAIQAILDSLPTG